MSVNDEHFRSVYLGLCGVIETGFAESRNPFSILEKMASVGNGLYPHCDWKNLVEVVRLHNINPLTDAQSKSAHQWIVENVQATKFGQLTIFAADDWTLQPYWSFADVKFDEPIQHQHVQSGPSFAPPILRDAARVCGGWYSHSEFSYSEEELADQARQGFLTRKQGEGPKHIGSAAVWPIVIWSCLSELSKASNILETCQVKPDSIRFYGGYASGDRFELTQ